MADEYKDAQVAVEVVEAVPMSALASIEKAEIDVQIATARAYPRSLTEFKRRATEMATIDEETAASCIYSRPVGGGKIAEGESIRMAEIVAATYGNIRRASMVVEITPRYVKARGMAHDLETNNAAASEVVESTVKKDGTPYGERQRAVMAKVACAKAERDAVFKVIPKALCKSIKEAARDVALGKGQTMDERRDRLMGWVDEVGVEPERVFKALGITGLEDIGMKELETLTGLRTAIRDKDTTINDAFPRDEIKGPQRKGKKAKKEKLGGSPAPVPPTTDGSENEELPL